MVCICRYWLVYDSVFSSFRTTTESITASTCVFIPTAQYCAVLICTMPYLTFRWVHAPLDALFVALIAFEEPITVQYWCVLTSIDIFTGFIPSRLSLLARTNNSVGILHVTAQYVNAWACAVARNPNHRNKHESGLELHWEYKPELKTWVAWACDRGWAWDGGFGATVWGWEWCNQWLHQSRLRPIQWKRFLDQDQTSPTFNCSGMNWEWDSPLGWN